MRKSHYFLYRYPVIELKKLNKISSLTFQIMDDITNISSAIRQRIEDDFNSLFEKKRITPFKSHYILPNRYEYNGENVDGKHDGDGVITTNNDIIIGTFVNGILKNGIIHNKKNEYVCYMIDNMTFINVVDGNVYITYIYQVSGFTQWSNDYTAIGIILSRDSINIYVNDFSNILSNVSEIVYTNNNTVRFRAPLLGMFGDGNRFIGIDINRDTNNSNLSKIYKNYTGIDQGNIYTFNLSLFSDDIVNKPSRNPKYIDYVQYTHDRSAKKSRST